VTPAEAAPVLEGFVGVGRRFQTVAEVAGVTVVDDYAHHPSEIAATIAAARERGAARVVVLFQPHLYSRTRHLAAELGAALSAADAVCVTDVYPAREEPLPGIDGRLVVRALDPAVRAGWAPPVDDGVGVLAAWARAGDLVLTVGAGDVERAGPLLAEALT
jgi:UDP-N-acetylmuramate--alanine ligase